MGIGFDETSMTGVMRHQIAGDLIMDGDPGCDQARRVWNGMIDRRPRAIVRASAATPFPNRAARFWLNIYGFWPDPGDDAARTAFIRGFAADMAPLATGGRYVNFMAAEDQGAAAAGPPVYDARAGERLAALKRRYDPDNVFRLNHNIAP